MQGKKNSATFFKEKVENALSEINLAKSNLWSFDLLQYQQTEIELKGRAREQYEIG